MYSFTFFIHQFWPLSHVIYLPLISIGLERLTKHPHLMQSIFPSPSLISVASSPVNINSPSLFLSPTRVRSKSSEAPTGTDSEGPKVSPLTEPENLCTADKDIYVKDKIAEISLTNVEVADVNGMVWKPYGSISSTEGNSKIVENSSPIFLKYSLFSDSEVLNKSEELNQK